jgi:hypothetical protein
MPQLASRQRRASPALRTFIGAFCRECGTALYVAEVRPGARTVAGGSFDDPTWFTVTRHIWVRSKLPWVTLPQGVAAFERGFPRPAEPST